MTKKPDTTDHSNFAGACYRDNSVADLNDALAGPSDKTDMEAWGLTESEWREHITVARDEKVRAQESV